MSPEIRHRKNAAEWIMWITLLPAMMIALAIEKAKRKSPQIKSDEHR